MGKVTEGGLGAPVRHPIDWQSPDFNDEGKLMSEMERVFDLCHGCRRCVSLCDSFPTLFDLVDESDTMEVDGVAKQDYWKVVDQCYLCDLCYMTKCPYVPPHEWNIDFPHLMLRAKAVRFEKEGASTRDKLLTSTDFVGNTAGIPGISIVVNAANRSAPLRKTLEKVGGIHRKASIPRYESKPLRKRVSKLATLDAAQAKPTARTKGKVALFATCYGNRNDPGVGEDLISVLQHNDVPVTIAQKERCCGMPKLELGDLASVQKAKEENIPQLAQCVDDGWDLVALVPSCVLMFRQEFPLLFPDDPEVRKVADAFFDPFEYLMLRHSDGLLNTEFVQSLGSVVYHASCHQRVQNFGPKTRDLLKLIPDTEVTMIERCSGHDGTYGVKAETFDKAMKIGRPVINAIKKNNPDHYGSDCPIAGNHLANGVGDGSSSEHPISLMRKAYGL
ncbi:MAG TPA: Fe-S oxidoreductase [Gammaproteobacteria bacterium]|jgi:glycerol-3-phosphate dehydrogenase subunit C|nr:Fe-S oxidoreductase [Gammaproteobacteria bacterium]|tara:strand:- start:12141 stop:13478 length:1338 start_codon:yes stop_codon:yes gene_type:complete